MQYMNWRQCIICLWIFVIAFVFSIFTMTSLAFSHSCHIPRHTTWANSKGVKKSIQGMGGGLEGGESVVGVNNPIPLRLLQVLEHLRC